MFPPTDVIGGFSHWHVDNDDAPPENVPTGAESQTNSFVLFFFFFYRHGRECTGHAT